MRISVWLGLTLALLAGNAGAAPQNAPPNVPLVSSGACGGSSACPGVPNDSTHPFYGFDPTVNASVQALLTAIGQPLTFNLPSGAATSANQVTANGYLLTLSTFSASASTSAKQDTGNTTLASMLALMPAKNGDGGALSHVTNFPSTYPVTGTFWQATQPVSAASLPLPSNAAQETGGNLAAAAASDATTATNTGAISTGTGTTGDAAYSGSGSSSIIAALKGIYAKLAGTLTISGSVTTTPSGGTVPAPYKFTPAAPDIATITTGGTAVNAFSAGHCSGGCIIVNPKGATVDLCVNGISTASGTTTAGALICIPPGQQFGFTPRATAISAVSSDSSHPFGGEGYQ